MKFEQGYWFPDSETHFIDYLKSMGEYQQNPKLILDIVVKDWRQVIDIGGHVGTWARWFSKKTADLHVFEPIDTNFECLSKNLDGTGAKLYNLAVSDKIRPVTLWLPDKYTNTGVASSRPESGWREIQKDAVSIDSLDLAPTVIKIDIQGGELAALEGAASTIAKSRPVLCWERSHEDPNGPVISELLQSWNYNTVAVIKEDVISVPSEQVLDDSQKSALLEFKQRYPKIKLTI